MRRFAIGTREVDLDLGQVRSPEGTTSLTPNEVKVLAVLSDRAGQVVEREVLLREALGYRASVTTRALDQAVWRLRRKLEPEPHCPRWLLAEAHIGYRLESDPPPQRHLVGRTEELARLCALLEEGQQVAVVGLPGSGRHTLIEAAARALGGPVDARAVAWMPLDATAPTIRLGPMRSEAGRGLLIRWVLSRRGAASLSDSDEAAATAAASRAGHHPATLLRMAEASVLRPLDQLDLEVLPDVAAHVAALPDNVRDVLMRCVVFPDTFSADDAGLPASDLLKAWRLCVLDSVATDDGGRRMRVPPCVRVALPAPAAEDRQAFVQRVTETLLPVAEVVLDRLDEPARDQLLRNEARLDAALSMATPADQRRLLPVILARWTVSDRLPEALPTADDALGPDEAMCHDLLAAVMAERRTPSDRTAGAPHITRALGRAGATPAHRGYALRVAFSRATWSGDNDGMQRCVEALEALCAEAPSPAIRTAFHHSRGVVRLRAGDAEGARDDLLLALSLCGPTSAARRTLTADLASEAARDGRAGEALAWFDRVDPSTSPPLEEARLRLQRVTLLQLTGRLADADAELAILDCLGHRTWPLALAEATQELLRRRPDQAAVLAQQVLADHPQLGDAPIAQTMVLGWARVCQGLGDEALALVEAVDGSALTHVDYRAQLDLLRAAALSRSSLPDRMERAEAVLEALPDVPGRWWPPTRRLIEALVRSDREAGAQIMEQLEQAGLAHLIASFARIALEP
jgi:DNA-binding winged helix-turn-helix (wHTH) protein